MMEIDLIEEVKRYGPQTFSSILFYNNIISSQNLAFINWLRKHLPAEKLSVIIVDIIANNVKNPSTYSSYIRLLKSDLSLHNLHLKFEVLGKL